jgi:signal transduction histidine kinase
MQSFWIKSPTGRRVIAHWADSRPAWLWSADGQALIWRNRAAPLFHGNSRRRGGAGEIVPLKGQIARLIRLGSPNRASLSRMQFLVDDRPVSATCACTPLSLDDGAPALLVVAVDPVDGKALAELPVHDPLVESLLPPDSAYLLLDQNGTPVASSGGAAAVLLPAVQNEDAAGFDAEGHGRIDAGAGPMAVLRLKASPKGATLLLAEAPSADAAPPPETPPAGLTAVEAPVWETPAQEGTAEPVPVEAAPIEDVPAVADVPPGQAPESEEIPVTEAPAIAEYSAEQAPVVTDIPPGEPGGTADIPTDDTPIAPAGGEPLLPLGLPPAEAEPVTIEPADAEETPAQPLGLASLFDRLVDDRALYTPLGPEEAFSPPATSDEVAAGPPETRPEPPAEGDAAPPEGETGPPAEVGAAAAESSAAPPSEPPAEYEAPPPAAPEPEPPADPTATPPGETEPPPFGAEVPVLTSAGNAPQNTDPESVERVSRYNFDELSRILNDRIGNGDGESGRGAVFGARPAPAIPSATPSGELVTLGGETLVLNRLPLGILVFRDQQILFANRAITTMTGYESVEALRGAGLASIFPAGNETQAAGPVNHLIQRDGTLVPVTARLQSVSWQGKPALMLSASATEVRTGHEAAVKAFAEHLATARADGFLETSRSGVINYVSGDARLLLNRQEEQLLGRPISALTVPDELAALKQFLERPARFAETARPAITLKGADPGIEIMLFALGQAGLVNGYFGFVRQSGERSRPAIAGPATDADPALLTRLSRGVRRPLNTVIGFSDLIASSAFGAIENERYLEYARDIKTAGLEIAALVDELDDFARLRDGRYAARFAEIDLAVLLDSIIARVRPQASAARVLVRSAISERLPRIRADRASLAQAILNLLASAIDQTPQDGSVVLSAQPDDAGGVSINVRDSAHNVVDMGERFVVFRDGVGRDGETLTPIRSSVGLALTRALLDVNQTSLAVDPAGNVGTLFSLTIPSANTLLAPPQPAERPGES